MSSDLFDRLSNSSQGLREALSSKNLKMGYPSTATLSKTSFWSGIGSTVFGFPANAVAIVSGALVEDRHRLALKGGHKKFMEKALLPSETELNRARIGGALGTASLIVGIGALVVGAYKHKRFIDSYFSDPSAF